MLITSSESAPEEMADRSGALGASPRQAIPRWCLMVCGCPLTPEAQLCVRTLVFCANGSTLTTLFSKDKPWINTSNMGHVFYFLLKLLHVNFSKFSTVLIFRVPDSATQN